MRIKPAALCTFALAAALSAIGTACLHSQSPNSGSAAAPPVAPVRPVSDDYFGTEVTDPYRYMENLKDPEVTRWFKDQDTYTRAVLDRIPGRASLLARIKELDQAAPYRVVYVQRVRDGKYFYLKQFSNEDVSKLYMRQGLEGEEKLLVDPDKFVKQAGTHYSLNYYAPSFDGHYVAYGISPSGSEDAVIYILDITTGRELSETIDRSWYAGISWMPDNRSFLHIQFQPMKPGMDPSERRLKSRVLLHRLGTDSETDNPIFGYDVNPAIKLEPSDSCFVSIDPRTKYALALVTRGFSTNRTAYAAPVRNVGKPNVFWRKLFDVQDEITNEDVRGDDLYLLSHKHAPRLKVMRTSVSHPDLANAELVVAPGEAVINDVLAESDALYVTERDGGIGKLLRVPYSKGTPEQVSLPIQGSLAVGGGDPRVPGFVVYLTGWTRSYEIYQYDPNSRRLVESGLQPSGPFDDPGDLESIEVKVPSYDGTMIPLSIVEKKGTRLNGLHPAILDGYGAYAINQNPYFIPMELAWLARGGILAFAHVRGGGEYGEEWHQAGMQEKKPNTWKDFIACAEYLEQKGYTSPARLAGSAGSAGGILIGRAFTERPDLFAAALDDVGLSDMIRDMFSPDGPLNVPEYGGLDSAQGFRNLYEISAYYHVKDGTHYPAIMLTPGMNDPRVAPWEPAKMAARLQAATTGGKPILLRVEYQGGHGLIGDTKDQYQQLIADQWSFLLWQFGVPEFQPPN